MSGTDAKTLAIIAIVIAVLAIGYGVISPGSPGAAGPAGPAGAAGTDGADGADGATGTTGATGATGPQGVSFTPTAEPESCVICHEGAGADHQDAYDELNQVGVITVTDMAYEYTAPSTHVVTFTLLKDGVPFDPADADRVRMYFVPWTGTAFQYEPAASRMALTGTMTSDSVTGVVTSTLTSDDSRLASSLADVDGAIMVYGYDEGVARLPNSRVQQAKYPIGALLDTGAGIDDISAANVAGCEKCHSVPFLKHGYYITQVNDDPTTDFIMCKACHLENTEGGHLDWQLLVDDPELAVEFLHDESVLTAEQEEQYAYVPTLMNDVHMSHAMEFPYPQSMSNCIVCHEGKLDVILTEDNFNGETCKSCHAVTGSEEHGTAELALATILPEAIHGAMDLDTTDCTACHSDGSALGDFEDIHPGYDTMIYAEEGLKYSDAIVVTIDAASITGNELSMELSASGTAGGLDSADIVPEVLIGLYGYDTKDFIVNGHSRYDSSGNGVISRSDGDLPKGAYEVGTEHAYFETVSAAAGAWTVTHDLTEWADMIADDTIRRLEIGIIPMLFDAEGEEVSLDAPSRTFDLATGAFVDYYDPIVDVAKCENCHDALATNYHSPDRGGSIVVCRLCHVTLSRGSHLELQSRSIDSYVHAIHSMQAFDIGDIDFTDAVEELHYDHHTGFPYPTHGEQNCESCHIAGMYEVPDQSKSLPGALSATDDVENRYDDVEDRYIQDYPIYITGPASRACGGCHRAKLITADDPNGLASFMQHTNMGGYLVEGGDDYGATLDEVIDQIMAYYP